MHCSHAAARSLVQFAMEVSANMAGSLRQGLRAAIKSCPLFRNERERAEGVPRSLLNGGPVSSEPSLLLGKKQRALFPALREYCASYNNCADLSMCGLQLNILGFLGHSV